MQPTEQEFSDYLSYLQDLIDGFNQNLIEREFISGGGSEDL